MHSLITVRVILMLHGQFPANSVKGLLPRDGRNISFKEMGKQCRDVYNFSPSFAYFVPNYAANMLNKSYSKDTFDLEQLSLHNGIEHDASLTRKSLCPYTLAHRNIIGDTIIGLDYAFDKDQGKPHLPYIRELLDSASGKDKDGNVLVTAKDLAHFSAKRRATSRASNPEYTLALIHRMFSSSK